MSNQHRFRNRPGIMPITSRPEGNINIIRRSPSFFSTTAYSSLWALNTNSRFFVSTLRLFLLFFPLFLFFGIASFILTFLTVALTKESFSTLPFARDITLQKLQKLQKLQTSVSFEKTQRFSDVQIENIARKVIAEFDSDFFAYLRSRIFLK